MPKSAPDGDSGTLKSQPKGAADAASRGGVSNARAFLYYVAAVMITGLTSLFAEGMGVDWLNMHAGARDGAPWIAWAIDIAPPFLLGFLIFFCISSWLLARLGRTGFPAYPVRVASLYLGSALLLGLVATGWYAHGIGLGAQFYAWPGFALVGGVVGDLAAVLISGPTLGQRRDATTPESMHQ
jgi:hypothetical protein